MRHSEDAPPITEAVEGRHACEKGKSPSQTVDTLDILHSEEGHVHPEG